MNDKFTPTTEHTLNFDKGDIAHFFPSFARRWQRLASFPLTSLLMRLLMPGTPTKRLAIMGESLLFPPISTLTPPSRVSLMAPPCVPRAFRCILPMPSTILRGIAPNASVVHSCIPSARKKPVGMNSSKRAKAVSKISIGNSVGRCA